MGGSGGKVGVGVCVVRGVWCLFGGVRRVMGGGGGQDREVRDLRGGYGKTSSAHYFSNMDM